MTNVGKLESRKVVCQEYPFAICVMKTGPIVVPIVPIDELRMPQFRLRRNLPVRGWSTAAKMIEP